MTIKFSDITGGGIPYGNTAGRPTPTVGRLYSNGETARLELYTSGGSWENIVQEVPGVSSISGNYSESSNSGTIVIYGTNFVNGAVATAIGSNGVQVNATSTTYNSLIQLTSVFTGLSSQYEPYDVKVTNPSNLFGILPDALYVNNTPVWQTAAGSLGTFGENVSISVSATATDDSTITYSLASGSSLPSGLTLSSTTGAISGTLPDISSNTTYTFTINASDGVNTPISRTFSITSNAAPTWVTASGSLGTFGEQTTISVSVSATDPSESVTYSLQNGSSLPSGITLNSSTGVISGTLPDIEIDTTYSFVINASDGINTASRTFSITSTANINAEILLVAGGGAGGGFNYGGGGGAGGLLYYPNSQIVKNSIYTLSVGNGGSQNSNRAPQTSTNGGNTSFTGLTTAIGGGTGGGDDYDGLTGGSSGGNSDGGSNGSGGATVSPTSGQGNTGGKAGDGYGGGGGGGAGSAGSNSPNLGGNRNGGSGLQYSITGTAQWYAGGGGGSRRTDGSNGSGGSGVGGNGNEGGLGTSGAANTGSGGGGGSTGGAGGSGVIVIAYPNTLPSLTISAGLTYDQPTRSGYRVYRFTGGTGTITF